MPFSDSENGRRSAAQNEVVNALAVHAKGRGGASVYARIQMAVMIDMQRAIADEIALGTQPNEVAIALGSVLGFHVVEQIAVKTENPAHIVARAAASLTEQCVNMLLQIAAAGGAEAMRTGLLLPPDGRR